jgi:hypothetical protein
VVFQEVSTFCKALSTFSMFAVTHCVQLVAYGRSSLRLCVCLTEISWTVSAMDDATLQMVYDLATAEEHSVDVRDCLQAAGTYRLLEESLLTALVAMKTPGCSDVTLQKEVTAAHTSLREALAICAAQGVGRALSTSVFQSQAPKTSLDFMHLLHNQNRAAFIQAVTDSMETIVEGIEESAS